MIAGYDSIGNAMLALGLTVPRVIGAFLMLPLLTAQTVPAMVRNSFLVSLAIVAMPIAMAGAPVDVMDNPLWVALILKELFLGISLGFCFGIVFWAIGAAGSVMDSQVGMGMASIFDPIQGHQISLHGQFLSQLAAWLFMASGAFLIFLDLLLSSYVLWPVLSYTPVLNNTGVHLFVGHFDYLMTTLLVMAAPAMVLLLVIDLTFGLVNRYAPQLNVFALTLPIKAWIATAVILLLVGVYVEIVLKRLAANRGLLNLLDHVFS
ncbi:type III secretion system export apparatus subunit SctT [Novilysobacter defluvii]|uniref:Type III secretion apparatus protein SpaR/YscT/HrcT n=1 Tax=Lysobacter defluvii IMMIB APB-9 = DSM 18482 TaxID=1385515 RepID=A0A0A0M6S8_9GAMM|nr:type III secretion system export apparatus subunit SctT [Lysobacter defluvii]KGO98713.1 type III secretion apparatus protein SpaR/YscT/HrcT [Lysobacter defluvii IMMIB APB-9 = DSM 18482]